MTVGRDEQPRRGGAIAEVAKVVFGSWPAFGLLFLVLFYAPLHDAINAIPEKVRGAEEIGVLGVSLKTSLRVEAEKSGALQLSTTLPTLSPAAVELLLRSLPTYNALVSYNERDVWLPGDSTLSALQELESKDLIRVSGANQVAGLRSEIGKFKDQHPGTPLYEPENDRIRWQLREPEGDQNRPPPLGWQLTDLGRKAVEVVLKAVAAQLAPKAPLAGTT